MSKLMTKEEIETLERRAEEQPETLTDYEWLAWSFISSHDAVKCAQKNVE